MTQLSTVLEVSGVTLITWAAYKALKLVEPPRFNCSPGFAMIVATSIMLVMHWPGSRSYGILTMPTRLRSFEKSQLFFGVTVLVTLLIAAPAYVVHRGATLSEVAGVAGSLVFFTGVGEELFFRGYVQSRLNAVFARSWRIFGAPIGPGLLIASVLFGAIHIFNPTKPYHGHWEVSWSWGANAALIGLLYGYLRELTGSIWTAAMVHSLWGEYRGLWQRFVLPHQ